MAHGEHHKSVTRGLLPYVGVWLALVALTFTTFGLAHAPLGAFSLPVAMAIAAAKTLLVVTIFMELLHHRGANRIVIATSVIFVIVLALGAIADIRMRFPLAVPPGAQFQTSMTNGGGQ